jgi:hypothetical protein
MALPALAGSMPAIAGGGMAQAQQLPPTPHQADWTNREAVEGLSQGIQRLADFLTRFGGWAACGG